MKPETITSAISERIKTFPKGKQFCSHDFADLIKIYTKRRQASSDVLSGLSKKNVIKLAGESKNPNGGSGVKFYTSMSNSIPSHVLRAARVKSAAEKFEYQMQCADALSGALDRMAYMGRIKHPKITTEGI